MQYKFNKMLDKCENSHYTITMKCEKCEIRTEEVRMKKSISLEELMIKAIRAFRKAKKVPAEIRNIYVQEGTGCVGTGWTEATFAIEYCKEYGGEYASAYVSVNAETGETRVE